MGVLIVFLSVMVFGIFQMRSIHRDEQVIYDGYIPLSLLLVEIQSDLKSYEVILKETDPSVLKKAVQAAWLLYPFSKKVEDKLNESIVLVEEKLASPLNKNDKEFLQFCLERLWALKKHNLDFIQLSEEFSLLVSQERFDEAAKRQGELLKLEFVILGEIIRLEQNIKGEAERAMTASEIQEGRSIWGLVLLTAIALIVGLGMIFLSQKTLKGIGNLIQAVRKLSHGDTSQRVPETGTDEVGILAREFNSMLGSIRERDERVLALKAFNENIVNSISHGLIVIDADCTIRSLNLAAKQLWGLEEISAVGKSFLKCGPFGSIQELADSIAQVIGEQKQKFIESVELSSSGGKERFFDFLMTPLHSVEEEKSIQVLIVGEDITEKVRSKEKLIRSERLIAIGRMTSHVTHEIRNPLSTISLNAELLSDEIADAGMADSEAQYLLSEILNEVDRLTIVTEEYLAFARFPTPRLQHEDLNEIMKRLIDFRHEEFSQSNIQVETKFDKDLPPASIDLNQIQLALVNLLQNARESMPDGGKMTVTTQVREGKILLSIKDSGVGIDEEDLNKIFNPFFSTKETGTGLGLPLTHQIIQAHGGELICKSQVQQGTTFDIALPGLG